MRLSSLSLKGLTEWTGNVADVDGGEEGIAEIGRQVVRSVHDVACFAPRSHGALATVWGLYGKTCTALTGAPRICTQEGGPVSKPIGL